MSKELKIKYLQALSNGATEIAAEIKAALDKDSISREDLVAFLLEAHAAGFDATRFREHPSTPLFFTSPRSLLKVVIWHTTPTGLLYSLEDNRIKSGGSSNYSQHPIVYGPPYSSFDQIEQQGRDYLDQYLNKETPYLMVNLVFPNETNEHIVFHYD